MSDWKSVFKKNEVFVTLSDDMKERLFGICEVVELGEDEVVYKEGTVGHDLHVLLDGRIRIEKSSGYGSDEAGEVVANIRPGQVFGELSFVDCIPHSATAVTKGKKNAFAKFSRKDFDLLREADPEFGNRFNMALASLLTVRVRRSARG